MTKNKLTRLYLLASKITLTAILAFSLYILGTVIQMKCGAVSTVIDADMIPPVVESILSLIAIHLSLTFLTVKFVRE